MTPLDRKVKLIPFEQARKIKVILSLSDERSMTYMTLIDQEAAKNGTEVHYLLINEKKHPIEQWYLKDSITVFNKGIDFRGSDIVTHTADSFLNEECDICLVTCDTYSEIANKVTEIAKASLKIGPDFKYDHPFDISIKIHKRYEGENIVKDFARHLRDITRHRQHGTVLTDTLF